MMRRRAIFGFSSFVAPSASLGLLYRIFPQRPRPGPSRVSLCALAQAYSPEITMIQAVALDLPPISQTRCKSTTWEIGNRREVPAARCLQEVAMGWSITAGSVAGTAVRIHVTFLLLLVWIFGVNYFSGGLPAAWGALVFVVLLFLCVLLHEFGHIFTARAFGVSTPDVILLPIGGVSRLERIPEKPSEEFLVAIAGPAVNVVIAVAPHACLPARNLGWTA